MSFTKSEAQYGNQLLDYGTMTMKRRASNQKSSKLISKFASMFVCLVITFCLVLNKEDKVKSFHDTIGPVIVLGNIFSIFPVSGIFSKNGVNLKFNLFYPITIYSMIIQLCFMVELVLLFIFLSKSGLKFFMIGQTIFTLVCIFGGTYFFYLAIKWRRFMLMWMEHERIFLIPPYSRKLKRNFSLKIQLLAVLIIVLSLLDHYIYFISAVEKVESTIKDCDKTKQDFWKIFYVNERQVFFTILPYYSWQIPFLEWYEVVKTMCWTYSEIFVCAVAITLETRFEQLTERLRFHEKHHQTDSFWHEIRCHYNILCNLVLKADKVLSPFILVYSFSNLFFICQKVFTQFENNPAPWDRYYSLYSSALLIGRTIGMLFFGASVNEKSREALIIMREVPNKSYSGLDYHRLLDVVHSNTVGLSGYRFFFVTRGMILTLAGTILTYELVLVQQIDDISVSENFTTNACGDVFV